MKNRKSRQMIIPFHHTGKDIIDTGIPTVLNIACHMLRIFSGCHHDGGSAHGNTMKNDPCLRVPDYDPPDPFQNILLIKPSHADISAFAFPVSSVVRQKHMIPFFTESGSVGKHKFMTVLVAVNGNDPVMASFIRKPVFRLQL